jgi:hypothetical protein
MHGPFHATVLGLNNAAQRFVVVGNQEVFTEEEIQFAGGKFAILAILVHGLNDDE